MSSNRPAWDESTSIKVTASRLSQAGATTDAIDQTLSKVHQKRTAANSRFTHFPKDGKIQRVGTEVPTLSTEPEMETSVRASGLRRLDLSTGTIEFNYQEELARSTAGSKATTANAYAPTSQMTNLRRKRVLPDSPIGKRVRE
ncbi:hypothetical protein I316_07900 [Kwoniella heveanensis BCC8398]|uniref:Uncharacterized protein n=1 Tax=Kwoniella heveanensis BCC8398 TaxID=1296120 RepID=A0A1B9GHB9_9TREE|nr:hypothetical protein I316_07900 [Kwoniella heveanensis BCC8398]